MVDSSCRILFYLFYSINTINTTTSYLKENTSDVAFSTCWRWFLNIFHIKVTHHFQIWPHDTETQSGLTTIIYRLSVNLISLKKHIPQLLNAGSARRFQRSFRAYFSILSDASTDTTSNPSSSSMIESILEYTITHYSPPFATVLN